MAITTSLLVNAQQLPYEYRPFVLQFIHAVQANNKEALANQIHYPLEREHPIQAIKNKQEMLARFNEVFDETLLQKIAKSSVDTDWQSMGWRGIMLGDGEVWMDESGKVIAINHVTAQAVKLQASLITMQKSELHPSLRKFASPILVWQTEKFTIRIDKLDNTQYRYASWIKGKSQNEKPDLVLLNGQLEYAGSGGNHTYRFQNGSYIYACQVTLLGERDTAPGALIVYKNGVPIMHQTVINSL